VVEPLRVLHTVVNMNRGGAETLLMNLYRNIDHSKVQFDFLTSKPGVFDEEIKEKGGRVHRIPYISEVGHSGYISGLDHFFRENKYKAVHSHMDKMSGIVLKSAKKAGIPVRIAHSHNTRSEGGTAARLYKWYAGTGINSAATHLVACSEHAARWLFRTRKAQAQILQNGIECDRFRHDPATRADVRHELGISADSFVAGHVGRFVAQKNHAYLIERFAELQSVLGNAILLLAGDGPLRSQMEQKVRELNLTGKVQFLGVRSDVERLLQAFDVFVFPSHHEGLPVTLIEAQGAGLPCIISDHITREVDMGLGLIDFLPLRNPASWVDRIIAVAQKERTRMIPPDALAVQGYDIKRTARWIEDYYYSNCMR